MIAAILFDWGRTLFDSEHGALFPEVSGLIPRLAQSYRLAIVSLVSGDYERRAAERRAALRESGLEPYFATVRFIAADKDRAYTETLNDLGVSAAAVAIVDDRAWRGIAWGNRHGATTIWLRRGRFADEMPDADTGVPTHTISGIGDLAALTLRDNDK